MFSSSTVVPAQVYKIIIIATLVELTSVGAI